MVINSETQKSDIIFRSHPIRCRFVDLDTGSISLGPYYILTKVILVYKSYGQLSLLISKREKFFDIKLCINTNFLLFFINLAIRCEKIHELETASFYNFIRKTLYVLHTIYYSSQNSFYGSWVITRGHRLKFLARPFFFLFN